MYPGVNCFTPFSHLICPRHPRCKSISALGSHQAADSYSAPWESHPRPFIVGRPRITEVSLFPVFVVAAFGNCPNYSYRFHRSSAKRSLGAPTIWLNLSVNTGNVPDEWVFNCQVSRVRFYLSLSLYLLGRKNQFCTK